MVWGEEEVAAKKMTTWLWGPLAAREKKRKRGPPVGVTAGAALGRKRFAEEKCSWAANGLIGLAQLDQVQFTFFFCLIVLFFSISIY